MRSGFIQFLLIGLLAAAGGAIYNISNRSNPQKFVRWTDAARYPDATTLRPKEAPPAAPAVGHAAKTPEAPSPAGPAEKQTAAASSGEEKPAAPSEFRMLALAEALEELRSGTPFIDARRTKEYEDGHIPTALPMSAHEADLPEKIAKFIDGGAVMAAPIVVYCGSSKECEASKIVCGQLKLAGFENLMIYEGGFPEWSKQKPDLIAKGLEPGKLPTAEGKGP